MTAPPPDSAGSPGDPDVTMLAAALRADARDVATYAAVLAATLEDTLPPGTVEVERKRSMSDRLAGRAGTVVRLRAHLDDAVLELEPAPGGTPRTRVISEVGGVVISRREVRLEEWTRTLAERLAEQARASEASRLAVQRLLGL